MIDHDAVAVADVAAAPIDCSAAAAAPGKSNQVSDVDLLRRSFVRFLLLLQRIHPTWSDHHCTAVAADMDPADDDLDRAKKVRTDCSVENDSRLNFQSDNVVAVAAAAEGKGWTS